jgi:glycosyltransferase involved in cell wall biosynthesis
MLNYEFPPIGGGAANAHLHLLRQYAKRDDLVADVLTSGLKPGFSSENFAENVTIYKVGLHKKSLHHWRKIEVIEWLLRAGVHYRRLLRANSYELVHAFFGFPSGWLCYRTAGKLPYIISLRGSDVPGENVRLKLDYKILGPVFKAIWEKAAALVACSDGLKSRALRFLPTASIDVIVNGVDTDKFHPPRARESADRLRLLTVGRLSSTKRVEVLIDSVDVLKQAGFKVKLTVVGGGALEADLREMVHAKGLDGNVEIRGRTGAEEMPGIYRDSDIYISATMQEGMSNAMLEAMASGLPIVTTRCEGTEELISDNGIVVEQPTGQRIADAVKSLATNEESYNAMSYAARKQAEKFTWHNAAERYLQLYRNL